MEHDKYKYLIINYLEGNLRDEELSMLLNWLDEDPANRKFFFEIKDIWDSRLAGKVSLPAEPLWKKSLETEGKTSGTPRWYGYAVQFGKYAAVIAITLALSFLFHKKQEAKPLSENTFFQISAQNGKQSQLIVLSDGTRVWLNASSTLKYAESFGVGQRNVRLDGEAYFEVTENKSLPFVVSTGGLDVKVLGTKFNVMAYASDPQITATLVEGKVELWTGDSQKVFAGAIEPGQQAVYRKDADSIAFRKVDAALFTTWKDGYYKFDNASFGDIAERLEKIYNVKITFTNESLRKIPYSGTFVQEQSIREILEIIRGVKPFNYTVKDNHITIKK
jgi:ferric-dicitrate binding protein FerR (iron transport regulator)